MKNLYESHFFFRKVDCMNIDVYVLKSILEEFLRVLFSIYRKTSVYRKLSKAELPLLTEKIGFQLTENRPISSNFVHSGKLSSEITQYNDKLY